MVVLSPTGGRKLTVDDALLVSAVSWPAKLTPREAFDLAEDLMRRASRLMIRQEIKKVAKTSAKKKRDPRRSPPVRAAAKRGKYPTRFRRIYG